MIKMSGVLNPSTEPVHNGSSAIGRLLLGFITVYRLFLAAVMLVFLVIAIVDGETRFLLAGSFLALVVMLIWIYTTINYKRYRKNYQRLDLLQLLLFIFVLFLMFEGFYVLEDDWSSLKDFLEFSIFLLPLVIYEILLFSYPPIMNYLEGKDQ